MLTADERRLLFVHCRDHPVARCATCRGEYRLAELGSEMLGSRTHLCRECRIPLEDSIRSHMGTCTLLRAQVAEAVGRVQATRQESQKLQQESARAGPSADALSRN